MSAESHTIEQFYKFCSEGKLMAVSCTKCMKTMIPPRPYCPNCRSSEGEWRELAGSGRILTYTVIYISPQQLALLAPYVSAIIELTEGVRLPGMVRFVEPAKVKIGMKVQVGFEPPMEDGWPQWTQYYFKPA